MTNQDLANLDWSKILFSETRPRFVKELLKLEDTINKAFEVYLLTHKQLAPQKVEVVFFRAPSAEKCPCVVNKKYSRYSAVKSVRFTDYAHHADYIQPQLLVELEMIPKRHTKKI